MDGSIVVTKCRRADGNSKPDFRADALAVFGSTIGNLVLIIAVLESTRVFRLARAVALSVVVMDYVEYAQLRGEGLYWMLRREVTPNIAPPLVAEFGLRFTFVFLQIASLSFLGVGIQPPTADWGSMVRESSTLISYGDITPLIPAAAIGLLTIGVNFVVDWFIHKSSGLRGLDQMMATNSKKSDPLVDMRDVRIDGFSDDAWHQIIKGVDLILDRGEVLGLIGESGAGKSTLGLAAMGFAKPGVKISSGEILFDGMISPESEWSRAQGTAGHTHNLRRAKRGSIIQPRPHIDGPMHRDRYASQH